MNEGPRAVHRRPKFISDFRENISPLLLIFALALHAFSQRSTGGRDLVPHDFLAKTLRGGAPEAQCSPPRPSGGLCSDYVQLCCDSRLYEWGHCETSEWRGASTTRCGGLCMVRTFCGMLLRERVSVSVHVSVV